MNGYSERADGLSPEGPRRWRSSSCEAEHSRSRRFQGRIAGIEYSSQVCCRPNRGSPKCFGERFLIGFDAKECFGKSKKAQLCRWAGERIEFKRTPLRNDLEYILHEPQLFSNEHKRRQTVQDGKLH